MFTTWLRSLQRAWQSTRATSKGRRRQQQRVRLGVESLETRELLDAGLVPSLVHPLQPDHILLSHTDSPMLFATSGPTGSQMVGNLAPTAPLSFKATALSGTEINLSWNSVAGANGYQVVEWINGAWTQIANLRSGSTSDAVTYLSPDTTYGFDVAAYNSAGSSWAEGNSITTPPAAPALNATAVSSTQILLSWNSVAGANGYQVVEWINGAWRPIINLGNSSTSYAVTGLNPGTTYDFDVAAYNSAGISWANGNSITTLPAAPALNATAVSSTQILLSWNSVAGANGYQVVEWINGAWTQIATLDGGSTSYAVSGLSSGTTYYFLVGAFNTSGTTRSAVQNATTLQIATSFVVTAPASAIIGNSFTITITAKDAFNNTVTGYSGNVALTSSDGQTVYLSAPAVFSNGVATATVILNTANTVALTATTGAILGTSGSITVVMSDWFSQNMPDPGLQTLARTDFERDGSLTFSDMLGLFAQAETEGTVTSAELQSLQAPVTTSGAAALNMTSSVQSLTFKVVDGDPANADFQGAALGHLQVGSSATQLQDLVTKWFLGADHPTIDLQFLSGTVNYALASGTLFGNGGPSYKDVYQGEEGDCWLLSSFAVTANVNPAIIQGMFTDDGTVQENGVAVHVWTVRFYDNGVASYLTVDNYLPVQNGAFTYADYGQSVTSTSNVLWVPLLEKAYAQLCESGWNQRPQTNAYASLCGGYAATALPVITGQQESTVNTYRSSTSFQNAIASGMFLTLASYADNSALGIVGDHDYGILGYRASDQTFTLLNPWGWNNPSAPGILHLTFAQLQENFYQDGNCNAALGALAISRVTIFVAPGLPQTELGASASIVSPTATGNQPATFAKPVDNEMGPTESRFVGHGLDEAWRDYAAADRNSDLDQILAGSQREIDNLLLALT